MVTASHAVPADVTPLSYVLGIGLVVALVWLLPKLRHLALVVLVALVTGVRFVATFHRAGLARLDAHDARELERIRAARRARRNGRRVIEGEIDERAAAMHRHPAGNAAR